MEERKMINEILRMNKVLYNNKIMNNLITMKDLKDFDYSDIRYLNITIKSIFNNFLLNETLKSKGL